MGNVSLETLLLAKKQSGGGGGEGGTANYNQLTNKPSVNGVTLRGNKSLSDLDVLDSSLTRANAAAPANLVGDLKSAMRDLDEAVFYSAEKNIEWVANFVNTGGNFRTSSKDKVSRAFTLYAGETVKVTTKGDGSYLFTTIARFPSLDVTIAVGYSGGTAIAVVTNNSLTTYTYTAQDAE
jgi:hypothetical protein